MSALAWWSALLAALAGSLHCIGMCGPLVLTVGSSGGRQLLYHAGRVGAYTLLGAMVGVVGRGVQDLGPFVGLGQAASWLAAAMILAVALHLAGWLPMPGGDGAQRWLAPVLRRLRSQRPWPALTLGLLTALLPCGLLYLGLAMALATHSAVGGAATMLAFGLGTVPALGLTGLVTRPLARLRAAPGGRYLMALLVGSLGLYAVAARSIDALHPHWLHRLPGVEGVMSQDPPGDAEDSGGHHRHHH
jgi:sulfite exporter TauE/SafE